MQKIKNIALTKTTHSELSEVTSNYIAIVQKHLCDNTFIINITKVIQPKLEDLRSALAAVRTNSLIEEVTQLDQVRDDAFILFRDMIQAYEKTDEPEEKEAYTQLWNVIEKVGTTVYREGLLEQSGRLETLFQEMDKEAYQSALTVLGITNRYIKLKTAEQKFKVVYTERLEEDTKKNYPTINEARRALTPLVNDLIPTLRNVVLTTDPTTNPDWIALINEQTDTIMAQVAARRTRKENEEIM
ncbi:DUF6261 family protein [Aquimarina gracilis]|uniref:DUF6261 family protein n=1 Tax=Aquimarina gracilis TaxID=874422 RepID=A0ABU5ZYQ0_9FLAO|nr:DUF6261 family protein [Aquimarina gracilis]MEB3347035.1 DUF6261 family protein [Aquimarina gracilis]